MPVSFVAVGKPKATWIAEAVEHYHRFLSKYTTCELHYVRSPAGKLPDDIRRIEGERILKLTESMRGAMIVCDRRGKSHSSDDFALAWRDVLDHHGDHAIVVIGGAWGLDDTVLAKSDLRWAFGPMTHPHELSLVIAIEQIARAYSILRGDQYHK